MKGLMNQGRRKYRRLKLVLISLLCFNLLFTTVSSETWGAIFNFVAHATESTKENSLNQQLQASQVNDLEELLKEPLPPWDPQKVSPKAPVLPSINSMQVLVKMPEIEVSKGSGGQYLKLLKPDVEAFSPVGQGPKSVTFSWEDRLSSWISAQRGTPQNAPSGYPVTLNVRDIKSKKSYEIKGKQTGQSGTNTFEWDGNDSAGKPVPDGIYEFYFVAESVSVTFLIPPAAPGGLPTTVTLIAPGYESEYVKIILDRKAPEVLKIHELSNGTLGIEVSDEVSGIYTLTTNGAPASTELKDTPIHVIAPVKIPSDETFSITVKDFAGNEITDQLPSYPTFSHLGDEPYLPQASGVIAGQETKINLFSGNGYFTLDGLVQNGVGIDLPVFLSYNHQDRDKGLLGYGWKLNLDSSMTLWPDGDVTWRSPEGTNYWFQKKGTTYTTYVNGQEQYYPQLTRNEHQQHILTYQDLATDTFTNDGRILFQRDRYDNTIVYYYERIEKYHGIVYRLERVEAAGENRRKIELAYDEESGSLTKIEAPAGEVGTKRSISFEYDDNGRLNSYKDVMGNISSFDYDELHRLTKMTNPDKVTSDWKYTTKNRVEKISLKRSSDQVEEFLRVEYKDSSAIVSNPLGSYEFGWDIQGRPEIKKEEVTTEKGKESAETQYLFSRNQLVKTVTPLGVTNEFKYDDRDRLIAIRGASGGVFEYEYNETNDVVKEEGPYGYHIEDQPTLNGKKLVSLKTIQHISDPFGRTEPYQVTREKKFTSQGLLESEIDGKGQTIDYRYDKDGNLTYDGFDTTYTYDQVGNMTTMTLYEGTAHEAKTSYRYNNRGDQIYAEHPTGLREQWDYDHPTGLLKSYKRFDSKNPLTRQQLTTYTYNEGQHNISETTDTLETIYKVDGLGNVVSEEIKPVRSSSESIKNQYVYDSRGLLKSETKESGQINETYYNKDGLITKRISKPGDRTTTYEYDKFGRLGKLTAADGGIQEYQYDLWDRQVIITDHRLIKLPNDVPVTLPATQPELLKTENRYNSIGQLLEEKNPSGAWTRYTYDENGQTAVVSEGGPIPNWTGISLESGTEDKIYPGHEILTTRIYDYDIQGRLIWENDRIGYPTEYEYDGFVHYTKRPAFNENRQLVTHTSTAKYDINGNLLRKESASRDVDAYQYDVFGNITHYQNPAGMKRIYEYDQFERISFTIDDIDENRTKRAEFKYDAWGYQNELREQLNETEYAVTVFEHDKLGQLIRKTDPEGLITTYHYDEHGQLIKEEEVNHTPQGQETRKKEYFYDPMGRKYKSIWPDGSTSYVFYNTLGKRIIEIDQEGNVGQFSYNADGLISSLKLTDQVGSQARVTFSNSNASEFKFVYDGASNLKVQSNPLGNLTVYNYDAEGRIVEKKEEGKYLGGEFVGEKFIYDPRGLQVGYINQEGKLTTYAYDEEDRLVFEVDPAGIWSRYSYSHDSKGYVTKVERPLGRNTEVHFNLRGDKVWEKDALGHQYNYSYDIGGRLVYETNKRGDVILYTYDKESRVKTQYTSNEGLYTYDYDSYGNLLEVNKPVYGSTYYRYDSLNQLVSVDEPGLNNERLYTYYTYDQVGNRLTQTDPNDQMTAYQYDYIGNKTHEIMYLNGVAYPFIYQYDAMGNLIYEQKPGGSSIVYQYDYLNRLFYEQHSDGRWFSYTYYNDGLIKTQTTVGGTTHYTYYDNGQVKSVSFPNGDVTEYIYDENGDLKSELVNGTPRDYVRDETGRTTTYTDAKGYTYHYKYDPDGYLEEIQFPNGVKSNYHYKPNHLIDEKITTGVNGESLYFNKYDHNKRDYVTSADENGRSFSYHYETREQMDRVTLPEGDIRLYDYDGSGNRVLRSAIIGGAFEDRNEVIDIEDFVIMILEAKKGSKINLIDDEINAFEENRTLSVQISSMDEPILVADKGGNGKGNDNGNPGNGKGNGNGNGNDRDKGNPGNGNGNNGNNKGNGNGKITGNDHAIDQGLGKKCGLYRKLGLPSSCDGGNVGGPGNGSGEGPQYEDKITGEVENILAVIDQIVNGEVNLPPGEKKELFDLVRKVGRGYTVLGTRWDHNERNEIIYKENLVRMVGYNYEHDQAGNLTTNGRSIYEWNAKGELIKVTFPDGFGQKYEYDVKGRRTKVIQFNHQGNTQWEINHHYKGDTWEITHETDKSGKTTMEYTYDELGRPLSITFKGETFWYVYNGHGDVVAFTDQNGEIAARYEYDEWGLVSRMYNRFDERVREGIGWMGDLNAGNGTPGSRNGPVDDNEDYDYHPGNGRGKAKGWENNSEDAVVYEAEYDDLAFLLLSHDDEEEVEPTADITTDLVKENPFRYAGYYWDRKTQLYYLQARYYEPRDGRFISMDPWRGDITNPLSLNRYVYAYNNPVNYIDPTGQMAWYQIFALLDGMAYAAIESVTDIINFPIVELGIAIVNGDITFSELAKEMKNSLTEPWIYVANHEDMIWRNIPRKPTTAEVWEFGKNLGYTIGMISGSAGALRALVKVGGKLGKYASDQLAKMGKDATPQTNPAPQSNVNAPANNIKAPDPAKNTPSPTKTSTNSKNNAPKTGVKSKTVTRNQAELDALATDPAIGYKITPKTIAEREVGLGLEARGKVKGLVRDPSGKAEFIDAFGQKWDVKAFNSNYAPKGYNLSDAMTNIRKSISNGENVMLDARNLSPAHLSELKNELIRTGLINKVEIWP